LELSWSRERIGKKNISELITLPDALQKCLNNFNKFNYDISNAASGQDFSSVRRLLENYPSMVEDCEWGIFEWHQILKGQWDSHKDTSGTQMQVTMNHLDRLVKLQQARCFEPEKIESDIEALLSQIQEQQIVEIPRASTVQLDTIIDLFRQKANTERENHAMAESKSNFYDKLGDCGNVAVFHMTICHFFTVILASSISITEARSTTPQLKGSLEEVIEETLHTAISMHKISIPFAELLSKLVTSWGTLNPQLSSFATKNCSLTELFAQQLAFDMTNVYREQIELLSVPGAFTLAKAAVIRMLAVVSGGHLDLTRPITEQLITKIALTITPGHAKPVNGETMILIQGSEMITVVIPTDLPTAAYHKAQLEVYKALCNGNSASSISETQFYIESEIFVCAGWMVYPDSISKPYKLTLSRHNQHPDLGYRRATATMAVLLRELGWSAAMVAPTERAPTEPKPAVDRKNSETSFVPLEEFEEMKEQVQSQRQLITQQTAALNHMNELIKSLQQQLQTEKSERMAMEQTLQSLTAQFSAPAPPAPNSHDAGLNFPSVPSSFDSNMAPSTYAAPSAPSAPSAVAPPVPSRYYANDDEEEDEEATPSASFSEDY